MLPNVRVSVTEEVTSNASSLNTFIPLVILKTKTGPIGQEVLIKSQKAFVSTFGTVDSTVPEAFGIYNYLKNGSVYVVRVVGSSASFATGTIKGGAVDLIEATTKYETADLNGKTLNLVNDTEAKKLYLSITVDGTAITSIKENFNSSTAKGDDLEAALDKIIASFNDAQNYLTLENLFVDKTHEDDIPSLENTSAALTGGADGNSSVADKDYTDIIDKYEGSELGIDAILAPGTESVAVVNKLGAVAENSSFIAIASINGTAATVASQANNYNPCASLVLYAGSCYLNADTTIAVPASIAVLPAFTTRNRASKWLAPAGVTRGTLSDVSSQVNEYSDNDLELLYVNTVPVNGFKKIAGRGYIVWGQKTTSQDTSQYQDRANVVRLCKYLTKEIYNISYDYLFEPITDYTYNSWILRVEALLEDVKNGQGLDAYKVIMDNTINTEETKRENKLIGIVRFRPLEAAEFIEISFVVTDNVEGGNR